MIKVSLSGIKRRQLINLHKQILSSPYKIKSNLVKALKTSKKNSKKQKFLLSLQKNLNVLLFAEPHKLYKLQKSIHPLYKQALLEDKGNLAEEIKLIFEYKRFCERYRGYGAYAFTGFLQMNVCHYCNRISTLTYAGKNGRTRPDLDHWLKQEEYPYLSLSLFNIIPSCDKCNRNFKRRANFDLNSHVHPYVEGYEIEYKFKFVSSKENEKIKSLQDFEIDLTPETGISKGIKERAKKNIDLLELNGLYNGHKNEALQIAKQQFMYKEESINEQLNWHDPVTGRKAFKNKAHYINTAFGFELNIENYGQSERSKFKRDLAENMGLLFP